MKNNISEIYKIEILPEYIDIFNPTFDLYELEEDLESMLDSRLERMLPSSKKVRNTLDDGSFRFISKRYVEDGDEKH